MLFSKKVQQFVKILALIVAGLSIAKLSEFLWKPSGIDVWLKETNLWEYSELFRIHADTLAEARERTFIMVKPDGVQRGLVGEIIRRFESKGFKLVAMKLVWPSEELQKQHYVEHVSRPFFPGAVKYMSSGPVVPMVWEGLGAVGTARVMIGKTNPADSAPGTIRGDFGVQVERNVIHGSDSVESALREISLWFNDEELVKWTATGSNWLYGTN